MSLVLLYRRFFFPIFVVAAVLLEMHGHSIVALRHFHSQSWVFLFFGTFLPSAFSHLPTVVVFFISFFHFEFDLICDEHRPQISTTCLTLNVDSKWLPLVVTGEKTALGAPAMAWPWLVVTAHLFVYHLTWKGQRSRDSSFSFDAIE